MRHARLLIALLLAATVLVDLVVVSWVASLEAPPDWPHPAALVLYSLLMSQVSLVAIWTGFGRRSLPWRVMGLVLTVLLWIRPVTWLVHPSDIKDCATMWTFLLLAQAGVILLLLGFARFCGVELAGTGDEDSVERTATSAPRFQFSLWYLLSWITVAAVGLGILIHTIDYRLLPSSQHFWCGLAGWSLSNAGLALVALWAALARRHWGLRALALGLTTAACATVCVGTQGLASFSAAVALAALETTWLVVSLWVFRVAGYRVMLPCRASLERGRGSPESR